MKQDSSNLIKDVKKNSPANKSGICPGSYLYSINGNIIKDIFDYHYFCEDENLRVVTRDEDGSKNEYTIQKSLSEDLGIVFENALLDEYHSCTNKCIFCFIDQMPKGMRDTLYFKDDDTRLSFLQGNYVTLTNIKDDELSRIIDYRLAPINISIHATNPKIRRMMLGNRFAGDILDKMQRIYDANLPMNGQIVLCKGINDGDILTDTIRSLMPFYPMLQSISVVPVGLTKYREGLHPLECYEKEDAKEVLRQIHSLQDECQKKLGTRLLFASDEWYIMAKSHLPKDDYYEGYPQLENGVGMMRLFLDEFATEAKALDKRLRKCETNVSIATGLLAAPYIKRACDKLMERYPGIKVSVFPIVNDFFGEKVTVSGLITGGDIIKQLSKKELGKKLIIPVNMLRYKERVFLDDITIEDVERKLNIKICVSSAGGDSLVRDIIE